MAVELNERSAYPSFSRVTSTCAAARRTGEVSTTSTRMGHHVRAIPRDGYVGHTLFVQSMALLATPFIACLTSRMMSGIILAGSIG